MAEMTREFKLIRDLTVVLEVCQTISPNEQPRFDKVLDEARRYLTRKG